MSAQNFPQYNGEDDGNDLQTETWDQTRLDLISDIIVIPEPDASFDAIMNIEVFKHLSEPINGIKGFLHLLWPRSYLILTATFCSLTRFPLYQD